MTGQAEILEIWGTPKSAAALAAPLRCYSLARPNGACDVNCASRIASWGERFAAYAARRPNEGFDLLERRFELGGGDVELTVFEHPLALLEVPQKIEEYDRQIGDKSRNMTRKALRAGYRFEPDANGSDHLQSIFDIRNSSPRRLDMPIPEYWKKPASAPISNKGLCDWHGELFYGVFLGPRMVAYTTLYLFGELAQFNQLLGHAEHLSNGVMNLLVRSVVERLPLTHPHVRAINYLYPDAKYKLGRFKRGIGAVPRRTLTTLASPTQARAIEQRFAPTDVERKIAPPAKAESIDINLEHDSADWDVASPADEGEWPLKQLSLQAGDLVALAGFPDNEQRELGRAIRSAGGVPRALSAHEVPSERVAAILLAPSAEQLPRALGKQLTDYAASLAERGWLVVRFPHAPELAQQSGKLSVAEAEDVKRFFGRRFRSASPGGDDYRRGFKGGDFQLRGLLELGNSRDGLGWLMLRKVSNR